AAGGPTARADLVAVNLAERVTDGEQIVVPALGEAPTARLAPTRGHRPRAGGRTRGSSRAHASGRRSRKPLPDAPVDLNGADVPALEQLPGIGPALAERIVAYRRINGRFASPAELLDVAGMTQPRVDEIAPYVVIR
ncbi:MAG: ComEA family DNA-binding protein, partial [Vulcanimicrobiaceae bacterium]